MVVVLFDHLSSDIPCTRKERLEIHRLEEDYLGLCYRYCSHDLGSRRPALHLQGKSPSLVYFGHAQCTTRRARVVITRVLVQTRTGTHSSRP